MDKLTVTREMQATRGRYVGKVEGSPAEAELNFSRPDPMRLVAERTFTPPTLRGRGIAAALVERLVADARAEGFKIVPLCSYVVAQFDRHPEWSDLRA